MNPQLILLGAPGAGKGTLAALLVEEFGYSHISTGDLLRKEVSQKTELGSRISDIMNSGALVDDKLVLELLAANCNLNDNCYIFDGFPRNIEQAKALDAAVLKNTKSLAVYFEIDLEIIVKRLVNRRNCKDCGEIYNLISKAPRKNGLCDSCSGELVQRKDDTEAVVKNRLDVFSTTIFPVLDYYQNKGKLVRLDASKDPSELLKEIEKILN